MDNSIESNKKFKIKYTKNDGEEVRRFGIVNDDCRGLGNRQKDNHEKCKVGQSMQGLD